MHSPPELDVNQAFAAAATLDKGRCESCTRAPGCVCLKAGSRPAWFCEEFAQPARGAGGTVSQPGRSRQ
jgi:hypothetical protein